MNRRRFRAVGLRPVSHLRWTWPLASVLSLTVVGLWLLGRYGPSGRDVLDTCCTYRADLSTGRALLTLLPSMFSPALSLPVWGAVAQIAVVFGIGQAMLGWRRSLVVALAGHVVTTIIIRLAIVHLFPEELARYLHDRDTGPSVATLTLLTYLAFTLDKKVFVVVIGAALITVLAVQPSLAASEHLIAAGVGLIAGFVSRWSDGRSERHRLVRRPAS